MANKFSKSIKTLQSEVKSGQAQVKVRSKSGQGQIKVRSRSGQGQGQVKVKSVRFNFYFYFIFNTKMGCVENAQKHCNSQWSPEKKSFISY